MQYQSQTFGRTVTLAGSLAASTNSIVTTLASSQSPVDLAGTDFTGANAGTFKLPQNVSVTTSANDLTYNVTNPIVVTGTDINGTVVSENLALTAVSGGEKITG